MVEPSGTALCAALDALAEPALFALGGVFTDAHYDSAVFEAFKRIESRVRMVTQLDESGTDLMARAFRHDPLVSLCRGSLAEPPETSKLGIGFYSRVQVRPSETPPAHEPPLTSDPQVLPWSTCVRQSSDACPRPNLTD